jgi:formate hydrogenlyase transcriptional activator
MRKLSSYSWPGNVRELENVIERAVILTTGNLLAFDATWLISEAASPAPSAAVEEGTLAEIERRHILQVLEGVQWRIAGRGGAAEQLGLKPSTLRSRMEKLGLRRGLAREGR